MSNGHKSDCATHNAHALPKGECDCGANLMLEWTERGGYLDAFLGDFDHGDGVRFTLVHMPTRYRRGPWRLLVEVADKNGTWGCFDDQDRPMRWYHSEERAKAEASAIMRVFLSDHKGGAQAMSAMQERGRNWWDIWLTGAVAIINDGPDQKRRNEMIDDILSFAAEREDKARREAVELIRKHAEGWKEVGKPFFASALNRIAELVQGPSPATEKCDCGAGFNTKNGHHQECAAY